MNLELLESFGQSYPEENDGTLDSGSVALTCAFNRHGTLLAVGCNDGRVAIWDFLTRGVTKTHANHVHPICSLSWSRNGRLLLSSATDFTVCVTDVLTGDLIVRYHFPSVVNKVQFHPRNNCVFLACPMKHSPVVVDIVKDDHQTAPTNGEPEFNMTASYDRKGGRVYVGNSKGMIGVLDSLTLETLTSFRITTGANTPTALRSIEFARRGDHFLVNSSDRIIRVFDSDDVLRSRQENREPECIQRLQDLVNRTQWKKCCFSGDGEYIVAGSSRQHALNIWDKASGSLVKILQGMKGEMLLDVVWHPVRPIIASVSSGVVSIWSHNQVENWSAFAPDFTELEENKEYDEHESEFDIEDEDKSVENMSDQEAEDEEIDVVTVEAVPALLSSEDESGEGLSYLPIAPEVDEPEEIGMGQLDPDTDNRSAVNSAVPAAPLEGSESSSSPKKKTRTVLIAVDGCDPAQMETSIQPVKARSSATRSKGKSSKPRHSRRSQTKVKKRSQTRIIDDGISEIIEQIQAEVPIAIVENEAITGINQTVEAVDVLCETVAMLDNSMNATETGGQEKVQRQTQEFEPSNPVVKQPDIKPEGEFIPAMQHVYDTNGEKGGCHSLDINYVQESTSNNKLLN